MDRSTAQYTSNLIIRASAGTGKTFQLSSRYLGLLLRGCSADRIMATTFTRKAAGEILSRVLQRLAKAAESQAACDDLSKAIGFEVTTDECQAKLRELTSSLHRVRVGTLDSFFGQLAQSFSLEIGLPPRWNIADEIRHIALQNRGVEMLISDDSSRNASEPDTETPLTLVHLLSKGEAKRGVNDMLMQTVKDAYSLFQDSDRAAWHSLKRIPMTELPDLEVALEDLRTYELSTDNFTSSQIARLSKTCDEAHELVIQQSWDSMLAKGIVKNVALGMTSFSKIQIPPALLKILSEIVEHLRFHFINQTAIINESSYRMLHKFGRHYEQLKITQGNFLFDDMPRMLSRIVRDQRHSNLSFRIDGCIDHLLLDEFQDTSRVQWEALRPFAQRIVNDPNGDKSLFCVGDVKQAIYGWRGGLPEIFDRISSQFSVKEESLDTSFRSAQPIIDTVNQAFHGMPNHDNLGDMSESVTQWCTTFPSHSTARNDLVGYANIQVTRALDDGEKASDVVIRTAVDVAAELHHRHPGRSIGLLVRTNGKVASAIYQFKQRGIPASEEGGNPLTDSAAVLLICSVFKLADHPSDSVAAFHVCHSPLAEEFGLGSDIAKRDSKLTCAATTIRQRLLDCGYGRCVERWANLLRSSCNLREWNRIQQLVTLAYRHETTLLPRDFVARIESERIADPTAAPIRVMNVHQSKGLQFDIVVLGELEHSIKTSNPFVVQYEPHRLEIQRVCRYVGREIRALLPSSVQTMHAESIARVVREELCLLYVAMTRAKHALHMIVAPAVSEKKKTTSAHTYAGLLRAGLCDNQPWQPGTFPFECGNPDWHSLSVPTSDSAVKPVCVRMNRSPVQVADRSNAHRTPETTPANTASRRLRPTSPSQLEGGRKVKLEPRLSGKNDALLMGTLFHAWLEQIEWLDGVNDIASNDTELRRIAAQVGVVGNATMLTIQHFRRAIKSTAIQSILQRPNYEATIINLWPHPLTISNLEIEIRNEQRITVRRNDTLLNGNIDRLVVLRDKGKAVAADIIDYKTDRLGNTDHDARLKALDGRVAYYCPQMNAYRDAVRQMLNLSSDRIATRLVFAMEDEIVNIPVANITNCSDMTERSALPNSVKFSPTRPEADRESGSVKQLRLF